MRIAIDIDDTLGNFSDTLFKYALEYDKKLRSNGVINDSKYVVDGKFDWTKKETDYFYKNYIELVGHNLVPFKNAKEVIDKLRDEGNKIIIISARSKDYIDAYKMTLEWLKRYEINIDEIYLGFEDKALKAKELDIDVFLDDRPSICKRVSAMGIKTYIYDSKYNHNYVLDGVERVSNWDEFYSKVKGGKVYEKKYNS